MLTYFAELINNMSRLKGLFSYIFPKYCLGCKLISDNNTNLCAICTKQIQYLDNRCWICAEYLYEEHEHIYCARCNLYTGCIFKTQGMYSSNFLISQIIYEALARRKPRACHWLSEQIREYLSGVKTIYLLDNNLIYFVKRYLQIRHVVLNKSVLCDTEILLFTEQLTSVRRLENKIKSIIDVSNISITIFYMCKESQKIGFT